jgi:hypothetical protein
MLTIILITLSTSATMTRILGPDVQSTFPVANPTIMAITAIIIDKMTEILTSKLRISFFALVKSTFNLFRASSGALCILSESNLLKSNVEYLPGSYQSVLPFAGSKVVVTTKSMIKSGSMYSRTCSLLDRLYRGQDKNP